MNHCVVYLKLMHIYVNYISIFKDRNKRKKFKDAFFWVGMGGNWTAEAKEWMGLDKCIIIWKHMKLNLCLILVLKQFPMAQRWGAALSPKQESTKQNKLKHGSS